MLFCVSSRLFLVTAVLRPGFLLTHWNIWSLTFILKGEVDPAYVCYHANRSSQKERQTTGILSYDCRLHKDVVPGKMSLVSWSQTQGQHAGSPTSSFPHLQDVVHGLGPKGPACVEQSVAGLLHFVLFAPRRLSVPHQRPLQAFAAALKLLPHVLEATHVPGSRRGKEKEGKIARVRRPLSDK